MKLEITILAFAAVGLAAPQPQAAGANNAAIDPSLIPDPGVVAGRRNPAGGDCLGNNDVPIPCRCPPSQADLIARIQLFNSQGNAQGTPFNFPTNAADTSPATQKTRVNMIIIALQNFENTSPGVGCPAAAAAPNLVRLQQTLP